MKNWSLKCWLPALKFEIEVVNDEKIFNSFIELIVDMEDVYCTSIRYMQ